MDKRKKGFAMILALVIISALLMVAASIVTYSVNSFKLTAHTQNMKRLKYIAEGGIESAIAQLKNVGGDLNARPINLPSGIIKNYRFNQYDLTSDVDCDVSITIPSPNYLDITSTIYKHGGYPHNSSDEKLYTVTARIDVVTSYRGNDYISDIGSKTIAAIGDITSNVDSPISLNDKLSITGSISIQGNHVIINSLSDMKVNNVDKDYSGDSKIKLNSTGLNVINGKIVDIIGYNWFGDNFNHIIDSNFKVKTTQISLKQKQMLGIKAGDQINPDFVPSDGLENDMIEWKVPNSVFIPSTRIIDFKKLKNYIINNSGAFTGGTHDYISTVGGGYDDYLPKINDPDPLKTPAYYDNLIEQTYKNLYKVIVVDGDLEWQQPDYYSQSINWVVYCTGKIKFSSEFISNIDVDGNVIGTAKYLSDNVNCTFVAKGFEFNNSVAHAGYEFNTNISFCNLKDNQKIKLYDFLKGNLIKYNDGLDVRIIQWTERAGG